MSKFRSKSKNFFYFFLKFLFCIVISMIYCEYLHYYFVIYQCDWPKLNEAKSNSKNEDSTKTEILRVMAVADTHLLGSRKGHWFDKLRREWQMHRAFQTSMSLHKPDLILFLGDLFDEGKWCSHQEFDYYVQRFNSIFETPSNTEVLVVAGNHDIGFHYSLNKVLNSRFEEALKAPSVQLKIYKGVTFVAINSMAMDGDDCFLCKPARLKIEEIAKELKCSRMTKKEKYCKKFSSSQTTHYSPPILLQHYPLYRESDSSCSEPDSAPLHEKYLRFRERWECLSQESTYMLLRELQPRLVLSGHTHHGCQIYHNYTVKRVGTLKSVLEYTIPSLSWRNKVNPTFAMLSLTRNNFNIYKCHIPNENSVIIIYIGFGFLFCVIFMRKKLKIGNFIYFKLKVKV